MRSCSPSRRSYRTRLREIRVTPFDRFETAIQDGRIPFRDFTVEYPPGSIAAVDAALALPFSHDTPFWVVQAICGAARARHAAQALGA